MFGKSWIFLCLVVGRSVQFHFVKTCISYPFFHIVFAVFINLNDRSIICVKFARFVHIGLMYFQCFFKSSSASKKVHSVFLCVLYMHRCKPNACVVHYDLLLLFGLPCCVIHWYLILSCALLERERERQWK